MPSVLSFVHLSDIHFGQDKGGALRIRTDVRDRLVDDVSTFFAARQKEGGGPALGILVTGDIAYSGKKDQYVDAGLFLDRVAKAAGCEPTSVIVAPGNHDVDLKEITHGAKVMLAAIRAGGEEALDQQLEDLRDRELLYARFKEYAVFADGYGCPLDAEGGHAGERDFTLAAGRIIRFVSWNSALLCGGGDAQGTLRLGVRQTTTLKVDPGIERVVLSHHPVHWFADQADVNAFLRSRARVLLTGHEHLATITVEQLEGDAQYLRLAAGATTPPDGDDYTYNVLDFEWIEASDGVAVTVHPRRWIDSRKAFDADYNRVGGGRSSKRCELACPNFRASTTVSRSSTSTPAASSSPSQPVPAASAGAGAHEPLGGTAREVMEVVVSDDAQFARLRLRFFRKLSRVQRLAILVQVGGLPADLDGFPTMGMEQKALERVRLAGKLPQLEKAMDDELAKKSAEPLPAGERK